MEPVIMELERKETVVVVGHQAVLRFIMLIPHTTHIGIKQISG